MTVTEARRFVEAAEKLPTGQVDKVKLGEAIKALSGGRLKSGETAAEVNPWGARAVALAEKVGLISSVGAVTEQALVGPDGTPLPQSPGDIAVGIDPDLIVELRDAAAKAGASPGEVEGLISQVERELQTSEASGFDTSGISELIIRPQIDEYLAFAEANSPQPIGVDKGYVADIPANTRLPRHILEMEGLPTGPTTQAPRYFDGDHLVPASQAPERIARIQAQLVAAGLMEEGEYWAGFWDAQSAAAYQAALGFSNQKGTTIDTTLRELARTLPQDIKDARARRNALETFQAPAYLKPDPAAMAQDVKQVFRSKLGRDPSSDDLAAMTGALGASYRAAYEAEVAAARANFNAELGTGPAGATVVDVDPAARFMESFDTRYKPELDRLVALDETKVNQANVFNSLRNMSALIG